MNIEEARAIVAQGWCEPTTSDKEMDVDLAEAIAQKLVEATSKVGQETKLDLFMFAHAVDTEKVYVGKSQATGEVVNNIPLWQVVTTFYEDETPVLASGTPAWPMSEEQAEEIAGAFRQYAYREKRIIGQCENCRHWCNSVTLGDNDLSGQCRADAPKTHIMTGHAVWPFTEDTDWCSRYVRTLEAE